MTPSAMHESHVDVAANSELALPSRPVGQETPSVVQEGGGDRVSVRSFDNKHDEQSKPGLQGVDLARQSSRETKSGRATPTSTYAEFAFDFDPQELLQFEQELLELSQDTGLPASGDAPADHKHVTTAAFPRNRDDKAGVEFDEIVSADVARQRERVAVIRGESKAFRDAFIAEFNGVSASSKLRALRAAGLFNRALRRKQWDPSLGADYPNRLLALYKAKVPQAQQGDMDRMIGTLEFHALLGTTPQELEALIAEGHVRQPYAVAFMVLYVFLHGFGLANAVAMYMAGEGQQYEADKYQNGIDSAVVTTLIAGLGGAFGGIAAANGQLVTEYERPFVVKDRKSIDLAEHWTGKLADWLSFTGFSIGHPSVDAHFRGSTNASALANGKGGSALASTLLAGLIKGKGPSWMAHMDPQLLNASTPAQRRKVLQMMQDLRKSRPEAIAATLEAAGTGYKKTVGVPGPRAQTQAVLHVFAVAVSLSVFFVPNFWAMNEEQSFRFKIAGGILLGLLWGPFHKFARLTLGEIEAQATSKAAKPVPTDVIEGKLKALQKEFEAIQAQRARQTQSSSSTVVVDMPVD